MTFRTRSILQTVFAVTLSVGLSGALHAGISPNWTAANKQRLASGGTAVFYPAQNPAKGARLAAAIHVEATKEEVWAVISNPGAQPEFLSNVKHAKVTQISSCSQLVDHQVKVGFLPITLSYRYRTQQTPMERIDFVRVSGQVNAFEGRWMVYDSQPILGKPGTVLFYELFIDPDVRQRVYTVRDRA
jgi:ribosome-associated toxin RatA of RatAB toxin-antitoxin module